MIRRFLITLFFLLSLFLLLSSGALALGITPARYTIDYEPGYENDFRFHILNNVGPDTEVKLRLSGDYTQYATISKDSFDFGPSSKSHGVTVSLKLPEYNELDKFGRIILKINAEEVIKSGAGMRAGTAVNAWIVINVPVPGVFAELTAFEVESAFEGDNAKGSFTVINRGTEPVSDSRAQIIIKDYVGKQIDSYSFSGIDIAVGASRTLDKVLTTDSYEPGKYTAYLSYWFNDEFAPATQEATFFIGTTDVMLMNYTRSVEAGKINKVDLQLQSLWGSPLENVRQTIAYLDREEPLAPLDFGAFQQITTQAYIDVPVTNATSLDASLTLVVPSGVGTISEKTIPLEFAITQPPVPEKEGFSLNLSTTAILIMALVVLALVLIGFVLYFLVFTKNGSSEKKKKK